MIKCFVIFFFLFLCSCAELVSNKKSAEDIRRKKEIIALSNRVSSISAEDIRCKKEILELSNRVSYIEEKFIFGENVEAIEVLANNVNIRRSAKINDNIIAIAKKGAILRKIDCSEHNCEWVNIEYKVGILSYPGYISGSPDLIKDKLISKKILGASQESRIKVLWEKEIERELKHRTIAIVGVRVEGFPSNIAEVVIDHVPRKLRRPDFFVREIDVSKFSNHQHDGICKKLNLGAILYLKLQESNDDPSYQNMRIRLLECNTEYLLFADSIPISLIDWGRR